MLATVALLAAVIWVGPYLSLQPRVEVLPDIIPFSQEGWMSFVPDSAEFVAYVNYRQAFEATGNYSLFGTGPLVEIYAPAFAIDPASVEYEVSISLAGESSKEGSSTIAVLRIESQELKSLDHALQSSAQVRRTEYNGHTIFSLLVRRRELETQLVLGSLAIEGEHLVLYQGPSNIDALKKILDTAGHEPSQFFSQQSARTALYASGGTNGQCLALFIATFPTQIEGAKVAMKTVRTASQTVTSQIAFSFDSQDQARTQYGNVKRLYTGGKDYWIVGPFDVVAFEYDISKLGDQVRGL
ncbi:MAG: hypothetical protein WCC94_04120 [Candidatus Bathyarchaeia archaeon]